jgi:hypothetical protein
MKVDVLFGPENTVTVVAVDSNGAGMFTLRGNTEVVIEALRQSIVRSEELLEASKAALARIIYCPAWV